MRRDSFRQRGLALITVLLVSATILLVISVGLSLGSNGVLFISQVHKRNVALASAEAGVYEAMARLEVNKSYQGTFEGSLEDSGADFKVSVENVLLTERIIRVRSLGTYGGLSRVVEAELEADSGGLDGLSLDGKVYVFDRAFMNAIASPSEPLARPGNIYTAYQAGGGSYEGRDFDSAGRTPLLHATGEIATRGGFQPGLDRVARQELSNTTKPKYRLDPTVMTSGSFTSVGSLSAGSLSQNTQVTGDLELMGKVVVPKGVTLVVDGDAKFFGGLTGEGQVVVRGNAIVRTDAVFDPTIEEGVKLHVDETLLITHPSTAMEDGEIQEIEFSAVGDYFAQMPVAAASELSVALPVSAPKGVDFFAWYGSHKASGDADFGLWFEGDGTDIYPGLSAETKVWLDQSQEIMAELEAWGGTP